MILEGSQKRHHLAKQFHQPVVGSGHRGKILPSFTLDSGFCGCMYCAP